MSAVDPTYPLYPMACLTAAVLLLVVFLSSFVRQSWNLGLAFLCFWLFFENLTSAINAFMWSDNADIKLYVYCDIVSHLQVIAFVVKPMSTLLIMRRLYLIASLRTVKSHSQQAERWDKAIEWILGLIIPVLVAGPIYYVVQTARFAVQEGMGCSDVLANSISTLILVNTWGIIPPLISVTLYHTRVARILYLQQRELSQHFFDNHSPISRAIYIRILAIATIDVVLSLSVNIAGFIIIAVWYVGTGAVTFYPGWQEVHGNGWDPISYSWEDMMSGGALNTVYTLYTLWMSPILSFAIFGCFGTTTNARSSYWRALRTMTGWFGWKPTSPRRPSAARSVLNSFRVKPNTLLGQEVSLASCERGFPQNVLNNSRPSSSLDTQTKDLPEFKTDKLDDTKSLTSQSEEIERISVESHLTYARTRSTTVTHRSRVAAGSIMTV